MARNRTENLPDLSGLLQRSNPWRATLEREVLRRQDSSWGSATLSCQVAAKLSSSIILDEIKGGQRLLEKDICEALNVSRAPVREALRILERDRLVEFRARRGAIVPLPTARDLQDIFAVRSTLFTMMIREEMEESLEDLRMLLDEQIPKLVLAANDASLDAYVVATFTLGTRISELSRNRVLVDFLRAVSLQTPRHVRTALTSNPMAKYETLALWNELHDEVTQNNIDGAVDSVQRRIMVMRRVVSEVLDT